MGTQTRRLDKKCAGLVNGLILALLLVLFFLPVRAGGQQAEQQAEQPIGQQIGLQPAEQQAEQPIGQPIGQQVLEEIRSFLEKYYVEKLDWDALNDHDVKELFESLGDPYSGYLTPQEYNDFMGNLEGSFGGIGIHIEEVDGYITIVTPLVGTPAEQAGLNPLDRIIKVNNLSLVGVPVYQAVELIRGEPGTPVQLTILREGRELEVRVVRDVIQWKSVEGELLDENLGYIKISTFGEKTAQELAVALTELANQGALGYVLDLRNNGGGYLDSALAMAEILVPAGDIVHVVDRTEGRKTYRSTGSGIGKPLVVLVNKGSASAAEILAAAIQENGVGKLVGTTTFGKASVQALVGLSDGGVLKLTVASYLTPRGNNIDGAGVTPDRYEENGSLQLERAREVLRELVEAAYLQVVAPAPAVVSLLVSQHWSLVNGVETWLEEVPFIEQDRTYVPLRFVSENLGLQAGWDGIGNVIYLVKDSQVIILKPGSSKALVGSREYLFDAPVIIKNGRSYLPVRFLVDLIGGEIQWEEQSGQINIVLPLPVK